MTETQSVKEEESKKKKQHSEKIAWTVAWDASSM